MSPPQQTVDLTPAQLDALAEHWVSDLESVRLSQPELAELARRTAALDKEVAGRGPQTREEFDQLYREKFGEFLPQVAVCPGHTAPFEIWWRLWTFDVKRALIIASRGGGKTSGVSKFILIRAESFPGFEAFYIGPGISQGDKMYEHALPYVVDGGVIGGKELPHVSRSTQTVTILKNGSKFMIAPGCLPYSAKVMTDRGEMAIGKIVEKRLPVKVRSYDFVDDQWVWRRVVDWHDNGVGGGDWVTMTYTIDREQGRLTATAGHKIMRPDGSETSLGELAHGDQICIWHSTVDCVGIVQVESIEPTRTPRHWLRPTHRYDLSIEDTFNYCIAPGLLVSNTVAAANGPRSPLLVRDEKELMEHEVVKQAGNIPAGRQTKDGRYIPAQMIDLSTMKYAHGVIAKEKEEFETAVREGKRPRIEVFVQCIYEIMAEQPDCCSAPDALREARLVELGRDQRELCDCSTWINGTWDDEDPETGRPRERKLDDVCAGRLFRSRGFKEMDDFQTLFLENDRDTWEAEQECSQPSKEGVLIKGYSQILHGIERFEPDPDNGLVMMGVDWGGRDQHACLWTQELDHEIVAPSYIGDKQVSMPAGSLVFFAEIVRAGIGNVELGNMVIATESTWQERWPGWRVHERYPDYANLSGRLDWRDQLGLITTSRIKKDFWEEVKMIRTRVGHRKFFVVVTQCPKLDLSLRSWREENGREVHDESSHCCASLRYICHNISVTERKVAAGAKEAQQSPDYEDNESDGKVPGELYGQRDEPGGLEVVGVGAAEDAPERTFGRRMQGSGHGGGTHWHGIG